MRGFTVSAPKREAKSGIDSLVRLKEDSDGSVDFEYLAKEREYLRKKYGFTKRNAERNAGLNWRTGERSDKNQSQASKKSGQ